MPLSSKQLADLCHRLALSSHSGIDVRRTWQSECDRAPRRYAPAFHAVSDAVNAGQSVAEGLTEGGIFPRLMIEMVQVGEQSGQLTEVLKRLSEHYTRVVERKRRLLTFLAWPLLQLGLATLVIGLVILVQGYLTGLNGKPLDMLGWGLYGPKGLLIYANAVGALIIIGWLVVRSLSRGAVWGRSVQRFVTGLPIIGDALQKVALARIAWALHLLLNVEIDLRRLIPLALRSTGNDYYEQHTVVMVADVTGGKPLAEAFASTGAFPRHFVDSLQVAEEGGQIVESMARLSKQYEEEADSALSALSIALSVLVWLAVAAVIITMIFRIFGFYTDVLNDALEM